MADYYTEISEQISHLSDEELDWFEHQLECLPRSNVPRFFENDEDVDYLRFNYDIRRESRSVWFYAAETVWPEDVAKLMQGFLAKFRPQACFAIRYGCTCSKPRLASFGGGALLVTAAEILHEDADSWVERHLSSKEFEGRECLND